MPLRQEGPSHDMVDENARKRNRGKFRCMMEINQSVDLVTNRLPFHPRSSLSSSPYVCLPPSLVDPISSLSEGPPVNLHVCKASLTWCWLPTSLNRRRRRRRCNSSSSRITTDWDEKMSENSGHKL